ncbi:hypothetical protein SAMN04488105_108152 [Salipiger thiooxidans]|uniref:Uncharacterized protein n=1 Tax=Salipiger thiooxidans TaxID=282683 RepID=A0A1G7G645_9RHOB|nr:hypothetical protein [Salipiger thiooxidans]SDE83598.1 hypothetical protein SAMN04488105_108152 [Salipiger thiooxidans]
MRNLLPCRQKFSCPRQGHRARPARRGDILDRATPGHRLPIVNAMQANVEVAATTGDRISDPPAPRSANIDVAMGIIGTSVATDSAALVPYGDNFPTIPGAVRKDPRIYDRLPTVERQALTANGHHVAGGAHDGRPMAEALAWQPHRAPRDTAVELEVCRREALDDVQHPLALYRPAGFDHRARIQRHRRAMRGDPPAAQRKETVARGIETADLAGLSGFGRCAGGREQRQRQDRGAMQT